MKRLLTCTILIVALAAHTVADQMQLTLSDRYLSDPPPGLEKNDLLLTTGLKIKIGKLK